MDKDFLRAKEIICSIMVAVFSFYALYELDIMSIFTVISNSVSIIIIIFCILNEAINDGYPRIVGIFCTIAHFTSMIMLSRDGISLFENSFVYFMISFFASTIFVIYKIMRSIGSGTGLNEFSRTESSVTKLNTGYISLNIFMTLCQLFVVCTMLYILISKQSRIIILYNHGLNDMDRFAYYNVMLCGGWIVALSIFNLVSHIAQLRIYDSDLHFSTLLSCIIEAILVLFWGYFIYNHFDDLSILNLGIIVCCVLSIGCAFFSKKIQYILEQKSSKYMINS